MMTIGLVTHCMVSAMAVERYIGIRHGYYYSKNITTSRARWVVVVVHDVGDSAVGNVAAGGR